MLSTALGWQMGTPLKLGVVEMKTSISDKPLLWDFLGPTRSFGFFVRLFQVSFVP